MLASYALGVAAVVLIAVAWVGVQLAWRRTFPDAGGDADVLAGRMGCHGGCGHTEACESRDASASCGRGEEA